ncbi:DUF6884 domain-containing protein [Halobaculum limi]|uniref:DUF6884 domain-containing protein n=1 Tax=Halobaculum limi TaxID=3031916 RepID=UPI002405C19F|nr:DUF6884 domain-containing protein [Halobaculum sp. YSMS11]
MNTVGLVQAGACPFRGRGRAVDRYATTFFSKKADLARLTCDDWVVLTEGSGVVDPDAEVEGVDREFTALDPAEQARWSMAVVSEVASRVRKHEYDRVAVFADRPTRDALKERGGLVSRMAAAGAETVEPLAGIGDRERQERWLDEQLAIRRAEDSAANPDRSVETADAADENSDGTI